MKVFSTKQDGVTAFVSFERLRTESIEQAVGLKPTERIKGIFITDIGITVYLESK